MGSEPVQGSGAAPRFELAQVNVARLLEPLDAPRLADFVAALDPVNALAAAAVRSLREYGSTAAVFALGDDVPPPTN